ncbi:MAG: hypothetical protein IID42_07265 [Planctomycetes bacterium]|nr:hypothetical protein [Planctomycetota bacterium]
MARADWGVQQTGLKALPGHHRHWWTRPRGGIFILVYTIEQFDDFDRGGRIVRGLVLNKQDHEPLVGRDPVTGRFTRIKPKVTVFGVLVFTLSVSVIFGFVGYSWWWLCKTDSLQVLFILLFPTLAAGIVLVPFFRGQLSFRHVGIFAALLVFALMSNVLQRMLCF